MIYEKDVEEFLKTTSKTDKNFVSKWEAYRDNLISQRTVAPEPFKNATREEALAILGKEELEKIEAQAKKEEITIPYGS